MTPSRGESANDSATSRGRRTADVPIGPVVRAGKLLTIRDNKWPIICIIERDNRDEQGTPMELTKKDMDYMRRVLESQWQALVP